MVITELEDEFGR